ncbi:NACHT domain-containing protein [Lentzea sp. NPDC051838]|uniref:NACHT domain-containing protein n=1 Tax=Lentzea sp. NPDC051838 TaxID=3154849 RepID=UPI0034343F82
MTNRASEKLPPWVDTWAWTALGLLTALTMVLEFVRQRTADGRTAQARERQAAAALADAVTKQWSRELSALLAGRAMPHPWSTTTRPVLPPAIDIVGAAPERTWSTALRRVFRRAVTKSNAELPVLDVLRRAQARGDLDFRGGVDELVALLRELPRRQLIVLGEPGAGKSVLAARITLALCANRSEDDVVPVLLPLSSWQVGEESPRDWIKRRLRADYASDDVEQLVDADRVLAVADGLDELPPELHAEAVAELGASGLPLVVTSRSVEYEDAVSPSGRVPASALVVELAPLTEADATTYLSAGRVDRDPRWAPLLARLRNQPESALAQALRTPLMIDLARAADPRTLLDLDDEDQIKQLLLDGLVPASYPDARRETAAQQLSFLAGHLHRQRTYELAWWQLYRALRFPKWATGIGVGLTAAVLATLAVWLMVSPTVAETGAKAALGLAAGALAGVVVGWMAATNAEGEPRRINTQVRGRRTQLAVQIGVGAMRGIGAGLIIGLVAELTYSLRYGTSDPVHPGLLMGVAFGAITGIAYSLVGWLEMTAISLRTASPAASLRGDRTTKLVQLAVLAVPFGLSTGLVLGLVAGPVVGLLDGAGAALLGVVVGLARGPHLWVRFVVARFVLAARGRLPWRLMAFLAEAHELNVLRANGGAYQFRHRLLQDRLSGSPLAAGRSSAPAPARIPRRAGRFAALIVAVLLAGTGLGVGLPIAGGLQTRCGLTPFDQDVRYLSAGFDYECVGISDGSYAFAGDQSGIYELIQRENATVTSAQHEYVRVALLAPLEPGTFDQPHIRHALQGVYLAQKQANSENAVKVQVLLANEGRRQSNWRPVVEQLLPMTRQQHPLVAVVGLGLSSSNAVAATRMLSQQGIPMVAATANALASNSLFRITPSNTEYAEALRRSWTGPAPEFLLTTGEPDPYVQSLRESFLSTWELPEVRGGGRIYLPSCPSALLYAGRAVDDLIRYLREQCGHQPLTVGVVAAGIPSAEPLPHHTFRYAFPADPAGWTVNQAPEGFGPFRADYCGLFREPLDDGFALLYHDAAAAAFATIRPEASTASVLAGLRTVEVRGATGTFRFDERGNPVGKPIPIVTRPPRTMCP